MITANQSKPSGSDHLPAAKPITLSILPGQVILLAIWLGVLTGFGEVAFQAYYKFIQGRIIRLPPEIIWMAPLAYLGFFLATGAILAGAAWISPKLFNLRTVTFLLTTQSFFFLGYNINGIHTLALLVLAGGLGAHAARLVVRYPHGLRWLVRVTLGWLPMRRRQAAGPQSSERNPAEGLLDRRQVLVGSAAAVGGVAAGFYGWRWLGERRALAALPPAPHGAPNVIFIVLDTVRAASLSLYGYERATSPNLERLAQSGVCFHGAIAPASWTLPSHAAMFTGRGLDETRVGLRRPYDGHYPTLAEVLGAHGYETAGFVANTDFLCREFGLTRGFVHFEDFAHSPGQVLEASVVGNRVTTARRFRLLINYHRRWGYKDAGSLNRAFLSWLGARTPGRPFFAFLNYMDAHEPYVPAAGFEQRFGGRAPRDPWLYERRYSFEGTVELRDAYDSCIAGLDDRLGQLLVQLGADGALDNTVLIVASDHGEQFGEHGLMDHCNSLYLPLLHVPLIIGFPGKAPAGKNIHELVSLRDLPATIMDLVNLERASPFPGTSLARTWQPMRSLPTARRPAPVLSEASPAPDSAPAWFPTKKGPMKCLFNGTYHYIRNGDGREELYDFHKDPREQNDLSTTEQSRQTLNSFQNALRELLGNMSRPQEVSETERVIAFNSRSINL